MSSRAIATAVLACAALLLTACGGGQPFSSSTNTGANSSSGSGSSSNSSTSSGSSGGSSDSSTPPPTSTVGVPAGARRITAVQNRPGWRFCTDCAGGSSTNTPTSMSQHQASPSLSGSSTQIWIGGSTPYSNVLWWNDLGADTTSTHFAYDFYALVADPSAAEALEFDLNQSLNSTRWVFGTECSLHFTGKWRIWDGANGGHWKDTPLGCTEWPANTWVHIVWHFERVGQQAHFISLTINDVTYNVDMWTAAEPNYPYTGVSAAFQLDGNDRQQPYSMWVDNVTVSSW